MKKLLLTATFLISLIALLLIGGCKDKAAQKITVNFIVDGETYLSYNIDAFTLMDAPATESREDYVFYGWYLTEEYSEKWDFTKSFYKDITLYGYWQPEATVRRTVSFYDESELIKKEVFYSGYTIESYTPTTKTGYNFKGWYTGEDKFDFSSAVYDDISLTAKWEAINYTVKFIVDGNVISKCTYSVEDKQITEPSIPHRAHYSGEWELYELTYGDVEVEAVYTPVVYTATFIARGEVINSIEFTVEGDEVAFPTIPQREGYSAIWDKTDFELCDFTVQAIYYLIEYTATFIAEGEIVGVVNFNFENPNIALPAVPQKDGYDGKWEEFEFKLDNIVIEAVYTQII